MIRRARGDDAANVFRRAFDADARWTMDDDAMDDVIAREARRDAREDDDRDVDKKRRLLKKIMRKIFIEGNAREFDSHGDDVGVLGEERAKGDPVEVGDHLIRALAGEIGVQIGPARGDETLHVGAARGA